MIDTSPLGLPNFRRLASAYLINEFGTWIGDVALALLVFNRTGNALATAGLFLALRFLPSLAAPLLTSRVETLRPSVSLPVLYLAEGLLFGGIAMLAEHFSLAGVLTLAAMDGALAVTAKALTRSANANTLIAEDKLREGNAILNMAFMFASAGGPALAGVLVAWQGAALALAVDACTYLAAAVILLGAHGLQIQSDLAAGATDRLRAGVGVILRDHQLMLLFIAFGLVLMVSSITVPVEVVFAKHVLGTGDSGYGVLLSSWGLGMIVGGAIFAAAGKVRTVLLLSASGLLLAAGYGGLAASPDLAVACAFSAIGGAGNGIGGVTVVNAIQQATPLTTQSVVMAVFEAINQAMPALGFVIGGVVTTLTSARVAYAISATGVAVLLLIALLMSRARAARIGADARARRLAPMPPSGRRGNAAALVDGLLLAAAVVGAVLTAHTATWNIPELLVLVTLTCTSEMMALWIADGTVYVSGSFLGIMLAAVLLGGAPAMIVGTVTIAVGWLRSRESGYKLLHNLTTHAIYPLLSGMFFHAVQQSSHITYHQTSYGLLVLATFALGLALNFTLVQLYVSFLARRRPFSHVGALAPILGPEVFAGILGVFSAYLTSALGVGALLMVAIPLVVFQYLVRELLKSKQRGEELQIRATTDELTGFPNRLHLRELIDAEIDRNQEDGEFALMLLNIDHFKDVNDTLGHEYGDRLLAEMAPRLAECVGAKGMIGRFGGDEFAVVPAIRTTDVAELGKVADALLGCVQEPVDIGEATVSVNASIGVARYPQDGLNARTLLRRADIALRDAKRHRDGHSFYDSRRDQHSASQLSLVGDFRRALATNDQIVLMYHPIVQLSDRHLDGVEALVRWRHPKLGLLAPNRFLKTVEQTGLIGPLTAKVLDQAAAECKRWAELGHTLNVSVNLSVRNLFDPELPQIVADTLNRHDLEAQHLKLEITESMVMSDPDRALRTLMEVRDLGVQLAVDDFGTGHASLANLRMLPVDELKVDRSFVTPMLHQESDSVIVRSTIDLGHALGLRVVAEGVEDSETLEALAGMGCDQAQGYFFSEPIPSAALIRWADEFTAAA